MPMWCVSHENRRHPARPKNHELLRHIHVRQAHMVAECRHGIIVSEPVYDDVLFAANVCFAPFVCRVVSDMLSPPSGQKEAEGSEAVREAEEQAWCWGRGRLQPSVGGGRAWRGEAEECQGAVQCSSAAELFMVIRIPRRGRC